jgi:hypothetical protein
MNHIFLVGFFVIFALTYSIRLPLEQRAYIRYFLNATILQSTRKERGAGLALKRLKASFFIAIRYKL